MSKLQVEPPPSFVAGLSVPEFADDAANLLRKARADGYDFCVTSLALPSPNGANSSAAGHIPRTDLCRLESTWWSTSIVGTLPFVQETVLPLQELTFEEEAAIERMVRWACHMNIPAIIIPCPGTNTSVNMDASLITRLSLIASAHNLQIWVRVRLLWSDIEAMDVLLRRCAAGSGGGNIGIYLELLNGNDALKGNSYTQPEIIQMLHTAIGMNLKAVSLSTKSFMTNKRGYPTLSKAMQTGFTYILKRLGRTIRVLVEGKPSHSPNPIGPVTISDLATELVGASGLLPYLQYLRHLRQRPDVTSILDSAESNLESAYLDHLQSPLQPLGDDLEYATYETFEKDPVKYTQYEHAIFEALNSLMHNNKLVVDKERPCFYATIFVLGAGRGPLVQRALNAVSRINKNTARSLVVKVVAMDKNPNAILYLKSMLLSHSKISEENQSLPEFGTRCSPENVKIIQCDMRSALHNDELKHWHNDISIGHASKVDLLVSELLGSFGDNELSPECLEGAIKAMNQMNLLHTHCISIPQQYISFITPVSSVRLHAEAKAQAYQTPSCALDGPLGQPIGALKAMETPYVVRTHSASQTHTEKEVFKFQHVEFGGKSPNKKEEYTQFNKKIIVAFGPQDAHCNYENGSGYGKRSNENPIDFRTETAPSSSGLTIHGLLGTFDAQLFGNIHISIAPNSFSEGMFSWFPLYFPLRDPLFVPSDSTVIASVWRRFDLESSRVWYEWGLDITSSTSSNVSSTSNQIIASSPIHNPGGRSYHVKL